MSYDAYIVDAIQRTRNLLENLEQAIAGCSKDDLQLESVLRQSQIHAIRTCVEYIQMVEVTAEGVVSEEFNPQDNESIQASLKLRMAASEGAEWLYGKFEEMGIEIPDPEFYIDENTGKIVVVDPNPLKEEYDI